MTASDLTTEAIPQRRVMSDFTASESQITHPEISREDLLSLPQAILLLLFSLHELETSDDVADFFRDMGVKGKRGLLEKCPIANYAIGCGAKGVQVDNQGLALSLPQGSIRLRTAAIQAFVIRFDNGDFPDLEG